MISIRTLSLAAVALAAAFAGCSYNPQPVTIVADEPDRAILAGTWEGEYSSPVPGRWGTVHFELSLDQASAVGEVLMFAESEPPSREVQGAGSGRRLVVPRPLKIEFVEMGDGRLRGETEEYLDPTSHGLVRTVFEGRLLHRDKIGGTYQTLGGRLGVLRGGEWWVGRRFSSPGASL